MLVKRTVTAGSVYRLNMSSTFQLTGTSSTKTQSHILMTWDPPMTTYICLFFMSKKKNIDFSPAFFEIL
jgi:hypothetical protein